MCVCPLPCAKVAKKLLLKQLLLCLATLALVSIFCSSLVLNYYYSSIFWLFVWNSLNSLCPLLTSWIACFSSSFDLTGRQHAVMRVLIFCFSSERTHANMTLLHNYCTNFTATIDALRLWLLHNDFDSDDRLNVTCLPKYDRFSIYSKYEYSTYLTTGAKYSTVLLPYSTVPSTEEKSNNNIIISPNIESMLDGYCRASTSTVDRRRYHHTTTAYIYLTNFGISSTHNTKKHTMKERPIIDRGWMVGLLFFLLLFDVNFLLVDGDEDDDNGLSLPLSLLSSAGVCRFHQKGDPLLQLRCDEK